MVTCDFVCGIMKGKKDGGFKKRGRRSKRVNSSKIGSHNSTPDSFLKHCTTISSSYRYGIDLGVEAL